MIHEPLKIFYTASIQDIDGRIEFEEMKPCDSLVKGWVLWQLATFQNYTPERTDIFNNLIVADTDDGLSYNLTALQYASTLGAYGGIQVGSGSTPVTLTDTRLAAMLPNGVDVGMLQYQNCGGVATTVVGNTSYYGITRAFINGSGGSVVVSEIGAAVRTNSSSPKMTLILRDIVGPWTVANTKTLTVQYLVTTSVI